MYSNCPSYILVHLCKYERIHSKLFSTLSKVSVEIDAKINESIANKDLKVRKHPGITRINCVSLPENIKKGISEVLRDTSKKTMVKECESFARYLHSRQPPVEKSSLVSKASSIKQEVEDSINLNEELLSEEEREYYKELVQYQTYNILRQRTYNWQPIIYTRHKGLQYLCSRAASEYAVLIQIFKEMKIRSNFEPKTLFDFGSGVGTVVWAANETWGNSLKEFFCVDSSKDMNCLSEDLINLSYKGKFDNKLFYRQFLPASSNPNYDVVVSAYSLMELPSASSRLETLTTLWNKTAQYLVLIEQGTAAGFKIIAEARDFILDAHKDHRIQLEKSQIFSPCPHELSCPRLSRGHNIPCHFQINYARFPQKDQTRKELYSYVVFSKETRKSEDASWPRIVRPVLCRSRHVICRMCTSSGNLQEVIITANKHGRIPYKCARKSNWGDRLPFSITNITENTENKSNMEDNS